MAVYEYTAADENGSRFSGIYDNIGSISILREELSKISCTLLKAKRRKSDTAKQGKIKQADVITFVYNFAGMCSAGLSITRCLEILAEQSASNALKSVIMDVRRKVQGGSTLKDAFEQHRNIFSDFFIGMLEAGETGGKLSATLESSAVYLEKQADLRHKLKAAFAYPIVVGVTCAVIVTCLVIFVIPVFSKIYQQMHVPLPISTKILIYLSVLLRSWSWAVVLVITAVALLLRQVAKKAYFRAKWDAFKLNMPMFARLNRMVVASRFIRTFSVLASTGIPLVKALSVASAVTNNAKVTEMTSQLQQSIEAGNSVATSFERCGIFPPMVIQLTVSGEEAGKLPQMLNKGADLLDKDIERTTNAMLVKLEPALTVIMGIIIGFILISVYLPMFDYMAHFK